MLKTMLTSACVCAALAFSPSSAKAGPITLDSVTKGWWAYYTGDGPGIGITLTGFVNINILGNEYRTFYAFDTSAITDRVKSATLRIRRGSQNAPVTLGLWDVTTPVNVLRYGPSWDPDLVDAVFTDLGSGTSYGAFSIAPGVPSDYLDLKVNNRALRDLRKSSGDFSIGTSLLGYKPDSSYNELFFTGGYGANGASLILDVSPVPEPGTLALVLIGAAGIYSRKYRQSTAKSV